MGGRRIQIIAVVLVLACATVIEVVVEIIQRIVVIITAIFAHFPRMSNFLIHELVKPATPPGGASRARESIVHTAAFLFVGGRRRLVASREEKA